MKFVLAAVLAATLAVPVASLPAWAAAESGFKIPVAEAGLSGAFWVTPPLKGSHYVCPMDPDVHGDAAGTCPKCNMDLTLTPTRLRLVLSNSGLAGRSVRLRVAGKRAAANTVKFSSRGTAETSFPLPAGTYTIVAELTAPGSGRHVSFSAPFTVR